jgi:DNA invertase Pin-like site-specific DNA recombinase
VIQKTAKAAKGLIAAATYIRMSSDKQDASPDQQRAEVAKLAEKHGCAIVHEYGDDAMSGAETIKRKGFMRMIDDAKAGKFKTILCWDQDRFGRFDSIDAGEWIAPLRRAGVRLVTVAQGEIDWTTFAGRVMYSIQQEGKNQYLVDLSRNVLRGQTARARRGEVMGSAPYGYDRAFYDERGVERMRAKYGTRSSKPKNWTARLVPSDEPERVRAVQFIFEQTAAGKSPVHIARVLNKQKVVAARGRRWVTSAIVGILKNRAYLGEYHFGKSTTGRYHSVSADGNISGKLPRTKRAAPVIVRGAHEAIVPEAVFNAAAARMQSRATGRSFTATSAYMLTGLAVCGNCGERMTGFVTKPTVAGKPFRYYRCNGIRTGATQCQAAHVPTKMLEAMALSVILDRFLSPAAIGALRGAIERAAAKRAKNRGGSVASVERELQRLDGQIAKGQRNLLLADPEDVPAAKQILDEWRAERMATQATLNGMRGSKAVSKSADQVVRRAKEMAADLQQAIAKADGPAIKAVAQEFFSRITVYSVGPERLRYVSQASFEVRPVMEGQSTKPVVINFEPRKARRMATLDGLISIHRRTGKPVRPCDVARSLSISVPKAQHDMRLLDGDRLLQRVSTGRYIPAQ